MLIVKITVLLIAITAIYYLFMMGMIKDMARRREYLKITKMRAGEWVPKWVIPFAVLVILDIIGILASTVYLLFFL